MGITARLVHSPLGAFAFGPHTVALVLHASVAATALVSPDDLDLPGPFPHGFAAVVRSGAPVEVFVRQPAGPLHLGRAEASSYVDDHGAVTACRLTFQRRLPFTVVDRVRPLPVSPPRSPAWLRHLPADPAAAARGFIAEWYDDLPMPHPLVFTEGETILLDPTPAGEASLLLAFALVDAALSAPYGAYARQGATLDGLLLPVPLRPTPTHTLHVGPGVVALASGSEIHVGARSPAALRPLRYPGFRWSRFTG